MAENKKTTVRIRMYRQGLGDCFLLTLKQPEKSEFNILIDCGLLQGTPNGTEIMKLVATDIKSSLGNEKEVGGATRKWLDVVALTHEHADHISGFKQAQEIFAEIHFGEVWTTWLEDPGDKNYKAVRERFHKQVAGISAALELMSDDQFGIKGSVKSLMKDFFEEEILGVSKTKPKRSPAWEFAHGKSLKNPRYCRPKDTFLLGEFENVRVYILGPPTNYNDFTKVNPPKDETFRGNDASFALSESFFAAVAAETGDSVEAELFQPFEEHLRRDKDDPKVKADDFFARHYGFADGAENSWRRINDDWLSMTEMLALKLDSYTNNTCLAFAIEFTDAERVLLFPGDAQFANLISWQQLEFEIPKKNDRKSVSAKELLKRTVFYKVGHHGSHNATLKKHGLDMMTHPDLVAMIPVDTKMARSKTSKHNKHGWEMPEKNLFDRLEAVTRGRVILADEADKTKLDERCQDADFKSKISFGPADPASANPLRHPLYIDYSFEL